MGASGSKPTPADIAEGKQSPSLGAQLLAEFESSKESRALLATAKGQGLSSEELQKLDERVQASILAEAKRLRKAEGDIRRQIELELERDSLSKEAGLPSTATSSAKLQEQLDAIQAQLKTNQDKRASIAGAPEIVAAREKIAKCYKYVLLPPLPPAHRLTREGTMRPARSIASTRCRISRRLLPRPRRITS